MLGKALARCVLVMALAALFIVPTGAMTGGIGLPARGLPVISGHVNDTAGEGIPGAVIRLIAGDWSRYNYTFAGAQGKYSINCTFSGPAVIESEAPSYLRYRSDPFVIWDVNLTHDVVLRDLPPEAEFVEGTITFEDGSYAQGVEVRLEYREGNDYYDYTDTTDAAGSFRLIVFEGEYSVSMTYDGFTVVEEELTVELGGGPYYLDRAIVPVPPSDTTIRGFVTDGSIPLEGAFVVISDQARELQTFASTNVTGYYEASFWGGRHVVLAMYEDHDSYYSWIEVPASGTFWFNITLLPLEFALFGVVSDEDGDPVEGITVSLSRPHLLPGSYSDMTGEDGSFGMEVSEGPGHLVVSSEDPFEPGEYELYLEPLPTIDEDMFMNITLSPLEDQAMTSELAFDGWEAFSMDAAMWMSVNGTRYMRLFIDSFIGDGDLVLSDEEFGTFYEMMMDDPEMESGPLGLNTSENLTVDGYYYDRSSYEIDFLDLAGPVSDPTAAHIEMAAEYVLNGTLPGMVHHRVMLNMTYDDPGTVSSGAGTVPDGWLIGGSSSGMVEVDPDGTGFVVRPGKDPNASDEVEHEEVVLDVYMDDLSVNATFPQAYEGEVSRYSLRIDDSVPENVYDQTWQMGDGSIVNATGRFNHTYADDGGYTVRVDVVDRFGRERTFSGTVTVLNKDPSVAISADRQRIGEGETANISVTALDVPADTLSISWTTGETLPEPVPLTNDTSYFLFRPDDEGNYTVRVTVSDDDLGATTREIVITASNKDPEVDAELALPRENNVTYENETVMVRIVSALDVDELSFDLDVSRTDFRLVYNGSLYSLDVLGQGKYDIRLTVSDGDGGSAERRWSVLVSVNETLDHDGDGIPMDWEKAHGLDDYMKADGGSDPDGDGLTNHQEYLRGSDPLDEDDPVEQSDDGGIPLWAVLAAAIVAIIIVIGIISFLRGRRGFELEE